MNDELKNINTTSNTLIINSSNSEDLKIYDSETLKNKITKYADIGTFVIGDSEDILCALGLGSCVGLIIYDTNKKIAGLAHILLPHTNDECQITSKQLKYCDVIIPELYKALVYRGCKREHLVAKIVGGANIFKNLTNISLLDVGKRNVEETLRQLELLKINIISSDIGGFEGRSIKFIVETGICQVKTKSMIKEI